MRAEAQLGANHPRERILAIRSPQVQRVQVGQIDVGQIVAGKYELVRLLGKGAMGEVWLARHDSLGGEFAIKLVRPETQEEDDSAIARFQQEAQVSAKLSRKTRHIVSVSDHGEENGLAYLVMELLEGESLETRIQKGGALDLPETIAIVMQVARALGQAHAEGIVHRDLKPANVFLTKDEDGRLLVKLLDFGIARASTPMGKRSAFATGKDMVLGTPSYMSPEQARGLPTLDHRCDLWALAVVAYESLTKTIPWEGESIEDIFLSICTHEWTPILGKRPDLPPVIETIFARSFTDKLADRFRTAAELSEAFESLLDPAAVAAMRSTDLRASVPSTPELVAPPPSAPLPPASSPERISDPQGLSIGEPTIVGRRRKKSLGWAVALLFGVATVGVIALAVTALRSDPGTNANANANAKAPEPPASSAQVSNSVVPVPPPDPITTTTATAQTAAASATTKAPTPKATTRSLPGARPSATPVTPPPPPVVTAAPPPQPPPQPPPPATPPAATTAKPPPDKSQVF